MPSRTVPHTPDTLDDYHAVAETIGGPSLRWKDNVIQGLVVIGCTGIGAIVGFVGWELPGAVIGGAGSMILSTLISGGVIMILGIVRAKKHLRNRDRK